MCNSAADGGQRCAAHTREVFDRAEAILAALVPDGSDNPDLDGYNGRLGGLDRDEVTRAEDRVAGAAVQYASTDEGLQVVLGRQAAAETSGDEWQAASWRRAAQSGRELRARCAQARADDRAPDRADGTLPVLTEDRGKALTAEVQRRLAAAGLVRTSRLAGGENTGWTTGFGSTGFSVGNGRPPASGETLAADLRFHIVVGGKSCGLDYKSGGWGGDDGESRGHEPVEPERLHPRISAVFKEMGFSGVTVRNAGYQASWDDDVTYEVLVEADPRLGLPPEPEPVRRRRY